MTEGRLPRRDLLAALEARSELGGEYDRALLEGFVDQASREIDARVDARVEETLRRVPPARRRNGNGLAIVSLVMAIPASAIAGSFAHLDGIAVAWGGIVLVNVANAWRARPSRLPGRWR
jgi:hypothetical protein